VILNFTGCGIFSGGGSESDEREFKAVLIKPSVCVFPVLPSSSIRSIFPLLAIHTLITKR